MQQMEVAQHRTDESQLLIKMLIRDMCRTNDSRATMAPGSSYIKTGQSSLARAPQTAVSPITPISFPSLAMMPSSVNVSQGLILDPPSLPLPTSRNVQTLNKTLDFVPMNPYFPHIHQSTIPIFLTISRPFNNSYMTSGPVQPLLRQNHQGPPTFGTYVPSPSSLGLTPYTSANYPKYYHQPNFPRTPVTH